MRPTVSIIIPYFSHQQYLREAVESALAQTYENLDVIVVDDASPLASAQSLVGDLVGSKAGNHAERSYGKLKIIRRQINGGSAAAKNTGVRASAAQLICPLDSDDFLDATYIEKTVGAFAKSKTSVSGVYTQTKVFGKHEFVHTPECTLIDIMAGLPAPTTFLYTKEVFEHLGGYNENIYHDDDEYWLRALKHGHRFLLLEQPLYHYRKHGAGKSDANRESALASFAKEHSELYAQHLPEILQRSEARYFKQSDEYSALDAAFKQLSQYHEELENRYADLAKHVQHLGKKLPVRVIEKVKRKMFSAGDVPR